MTVEAEEVRVILKDGTVMRWIGDVATELWRGIWNADGEYYSLFTGPTPKSPETSHPLRKVTEVQGRLVEAEFVDDGDIIAFPRDEAGILRSTGIGHHLFPDGIAAKYDDEKDDYGGPQYRFRIEVFAEKVEEKTP